MRGITIRQVHVFFHGLHLVRGVDLDLRNGECTALVGATGSGRTALVRALAGIYGFKGRIEVNGIPVVPGRPGCMVRRGVVLCPADSAVFPRMTVEENLLAGGYILPLRSSRKRASEVLRQFPDLARRRSTPAGRLSGGERRQLALAKALVPAPSVLILEEPSRGLSPAARHVVLQTIVRVLDDGTTVLLADQSMDWCESVAHRVVVFTDGQVSADVQLSPDEHPPDIASAYFGVSDSTQAAGGPI